MSALRRVLIVEDETLIGFLLEEMVQDLGYEVAGVIGRLDQAMAAAPDSYDMAVLDVQLHGTLVFPFADRLISERKPFAFATGNGGAGIPETYRGTILLQKPFQQESLSHVLQQLSAQRASQ